MTIEDIIFCVDVVSFHNPNMRTLYETLFDQAPLMADHTDEITAADERGQPIYEALIMYQIDLANGIHDYVYNIARPFDSIIVKNMCREQVCRDIFGLQASF